MYLYKSIYDVRDSTACRPERNIHWSYRKVLVWR